LTFIDQGNRNTGNNNNAGAGVFALLGLGVLVAMPLVPLFAVAPGLCILFGAYALLCLFLFFAAADADKNTGWIRFCLIVSVGAALTIPSLCFSAHTGFFTRIGAVVTGGYFLALALGLWKTFETAFKVFAALVGLVLLTVLVILPPPEAAGDWQHESAKWSVQITVLDGDNRPIAAALTQCTTVMVWETGAAFQVQAGGT